MRSFVAALCVFAASFVGVVAVETCVDDCYLDFIPQTGCPDATNPNAPATPAYLACVCPSYSCGPLNNYLACVAASCNSPGVLDFFQAQCAGYNAGSPSPSNCASKKKRGQLFLGDSLCPKPKIECPIPSSFGLTDPPTSKGKAEMECIDPMLDIDSCGGCASINEGVACEAVEGVQSTSCVRGKCRIYSCKAGYTFTTVQNSKGAVVKSCVRDAAD